VLEAAEGLRNHTDIWIVLVGDGAAKADLVIQAQERGLENVTFLDSQPHDRMPILLAGADICLVPMRKVPLFEGALPSKMYEVMSCARPIVLGVEGEARRMVEQVAEAAIYVEPENTEALVSGILYLRDHPEEAERLGLRGRTYVEAHFDRDQLTAELDMHIVMLLEKQARMA
jgi:glycosyltransferase involved in cell wall biosynthesis